MPSRATLATRAVDPLARTVSALGLLRKARQLGVYTELADAVIRERGLAPPPRRTETAAAREARRCVLCPRVVGAYCREETERCGPLEEIPAGEDPLRVGYYHEGYLDQCGWEGPPHEVCPVHGVGRNLHRGPCEHEIAAARTWLLDSVPPGATRLMRSLTQHAQAPAPPSAVCDALEALAWQHSCAMYGPIRVTRPAK